MKEIVYNKLVRDKIPQIIMADGNDCVIKTLSNEEFLIELKKKLFEEVKEVDDALNNEELYEELADVIEIISTLAVKSGKSIDEIMRKANEKKEKRGGFEK